MKRVLAIALIAITLTGVGFTQSLPAPKKPHHSVRHAIWPVVKWPVAGAFKIAFWMTQTTPEGEAEGGTQKGQRKHVEKTP